MADDNKLIGAINSLRTENLDSSVQQEKRDNRQNFELVKISALLKEQLRINDLAKKQAEEDRRESNKDKKKGAQLKGPGATNIDDEFNLKGILQIVAGIGAAVAGFVAGIVSAFSNAFRLATANFRKGIKNLFRPVARFVDALTDVFGKRGTNQFLKGNTYKTLGRLTSTFRGFADGIKNLETRFARALKGIKSIGTTVRSYAGMITNSVKDIAKLKIGQVATSITNGVKSIFSGLTNIQRAITGGASSFRELRAFATLKKKILQPLQAFGKAFTGVAQNVEKLGTAAKAFAKVGGTLGKIFGAFKVIGRFVAFPLTIIMSIVDGFKGLMAGMERQEGTFNKIVGGFLGAIGGVIKGLIMVPLDLLKDGISWIASKLGFENFSKMLDSFSFAETFSKFVNRLTDGLVWTFTNLFDSIMKPFEDGVDFGSIIEFIITLPYKFVTAILDIVKTGVSSLLNIFGQEDAAAQLESFSFVDTFEGIIEFVKSLPGKLVDKLVGMFEGFDIGASLEGIGDFATAAMNQLKALLRNILPDPDSILANFIPKPLYEWTDTPAPPPPEKPAEPPVAEVDDKIKEAEDKLKARRRELGELNLAIEEGEDVSEADLKRAEQRVKLSEANLKNKKKAALDPNTMTDEKGDVYGDEFIDPVTGEKRRQRIFKSDQQAQAKVDKDTADFLAEMDALEGKPQRPDITPQTARGNDIAKMSKENAQSAGATNVVVAAPQQQTVNNNNTQSTTAVMDQNLPTVDQNDRTWAYGT